MKKIFLIAIILSITAFSLSSCDEHLQNPQNLSISEVIMESDPISVINFRDINFVDSDRISRAQGYILQAQVGNRTYTFRSNDDETNIAFIDDAESIIYEINNLVSLRDSGLRISLAEGREYYRVSARSGIIITVNHQNTDTFGWLVYNWSSGRLPVWLSVGIEALARNIVGLYEPIDSVSFDLENFGDYVFNPAFWGSPVQERAVANAYHFVTFLYENGLLDELAGLYLDFNTDFREADAAAQKHFYDFAGHSMDMDFRLVFTSVAHEVHSFTDLSNISFVFSSFDQSFSRSEMQSMINEIDAAAVGVKGWFARYFEFEYVPINHVLYFDLRNFGHPSISQQAGADTGRNLVAYGDVNRRRGARIAAHEITHIIDSRLGGLGFNPFVEGLAMVIDYDVNNLHNDGNVFHRRSHARLESQAYLNSNPFGSHFPPHSSQYVAELNSYNTAASFVHFLMDAYGMEKYWQVHWNFDNFENVYGITIHEMVVLWREFLDEYMQS